MVMNRNFSPKYVASLLIHEAYHVAQYRGGHKNFGERAEYRACQVQKKFLKKINYLSAIEWLDKQYQQKWWERMDKKSGDSLVFKKILNSYKQNILLDELL